MATFEIPNKPEHGPYRAIVATDGDYDSGHIRIEPPFHPGESLVKLGSGDGINYQYFASSRDATTLDYIIPRSEGPKDREANQENLAQSMDVILQHLGHLSSGELFKNYWEQY